MDERDMSALFEQFRSGGALASAPGPQAARTVHRRRVARRAVVATVAAVIAVTVPAVAFAVARPSAHVGPAGPTGTPTIDASPTAPVQPPLPGSAFALVYLDHRSPADPTDEGCP